MIISHKHKFIFLRSRKTGSTSMHIALSSLLGAEDVSTPESLKAGGPLAQNWYISRRRWTLRDWARWAVKQKRPKFWPHSSARTIRSYVPRHVWDTYYKFAFDRNPWDLVVSAYSWRRDRYERSGRSHPDFRNFVMSSAVLEFSNWPIYTLDDEVVVDDVFRYEDGLERGLSEAMRRAGVAAAPTLPRIRSNHREEGKPYQKWHDDETRQRVAEVFAKEIVYFSWTF